MQTTYPMTVITLDAALAVSARAIDEAERRGVRASVAIVDPSMNLVAFAKADGATPHSIDSSRRKANTSASLRRATGALPNDLVLALPRATELKLTSIKGGAPLNFAGNHAGAIGIAGGTPEQDAEIASAAAAYATELVAESVAAR